MATEVTGAPLIAHVIFRLDTGGLENGLVNLINRMPAERYRHAVVCIDTHTDFRDRIEREGVPVLSVNKKPGTDPSALIRLYRIFSRLKPDVVHTRNLAALDALFPAWLAGVRHRIHGEHGWNIDDVEGKNRRLRWLRKLHAPLVSEYVAVTRDLSNYLADSVGISRGRIHQIGNGVDTDRFRPDAAAYAKRAGLNPVFDDGSVLIGTVGRMHPVKNQAYLADAFVSLVRRSPDLAAVAKLVIVGDGEQLGSVRERLNGARVGDLCWLPGHRDDIPEILRCLDVFVLPSLAEGFSNTILEAMACGLPVIATSVGGNPELVLDGRTGHIVPPDRVDALADAIEFYVRDEDSRRAHGRAGRIRAETEFGLDVMLRRYMDLYDNAIGAQG